MKKYISAGFPVLVLAVILLVIGVMHNMIDNQQDSVAKEQFMRNCAGCHGSRMERFAGNTWVKDAPDDHLVNAIRYGMPNEGMPAFSKAFTDEEINGLVRYIRSELKDKNKQSQTGSYATIQQSKYFSFKIDTVATGLDVPWGMVFLPDGDMLVTERSGQLFRFRNGKLAAIIEGVPPVFNRGQGGLMDIILHPDYRHNGWIYISYSQPTANGDQGNTAIFRANLKNDRLVDHQYLFKAMPNSGRGVHFAGRLVFDDKGYLYFAVGERGNQTDAQLLTNYNGKVHRLNADGTIPADNPFVNVKNAIPSIYSYGHRNPQGIDINPVTREVWANEHGPRGGDDINVIEKGKNYGWPVITYGINYDGTIITPDTAKPGMMQPLYQWTPSIAPSSMAFVTGNRYPKWKGDVLSGSLSFKYLDRIRFDGRKVIERERLLEGVGRVRNVKIGPDGFIYVAIEQPGVIIRLLPLKK